MTSKKTMTPEKCCEELAACCEAEDFAGCCDSLKDLEAVLTKPSAKKGTAATATGPDLDACEKILEEGKTKENGQRESGSPKAVGADAVGFTVPPSVYVALFDAALVLLRWFRDRQVQQPTQ